MLLLDYLIDLIEKNIDDVIIEILQVKNLFKNYSIDSVLVISESGRTEQIVTKFAKDLSESTFNEIKELKKSQNIN